MNWVRSFPLVSSTLIFVSIFALACAQDWPNLDVVQGPFPNGSCGMEGSATPGSPKAKSNSLKNRYRLPEAVTPLTWKQLRELPLRPDGTVSARAVTFIGYVKEAKYGGTSGESCNCRARDNKVLDYHIDIVQDPMNPTLNQQPVVGEITYRGRILASKGLLKSSIGNDWELRNVRDRILGRWVKFTGLLFYDEDHMNGGFLEDPKDTNTQLGPKESPNWRLSGWEIHPIMGIEVLPGKPTSEF